MTMEHNGTRMLSGRRAAVELSPITEADLAGVAEFLDANLNDQVPWHRACSSLAWSGVSPNYGFMLRDGHRVVGVLLALYSERMIGGRIERFCNMGSWCVVPDYRSRAISLLKALVSQDGYHFTVLTADVGPQEILAWSGFRHLDTSAALIPNLPWPSTFTRTIVSSNPAVIESTLTGPELTLYRDHSAALAAHHLVVVRGAESSYVTYRRSTFRNKPVALLLHVGNPDLFHRALRSVTSHLLVRHRLVATLAELQIIGHRPTGSLTVRNWPKMFRSTSLDPRYIDYLYSELACVPW